MSKDFNSDMFSAILASNEKTMSLLSDQLDKAREQAKWNEIKFYVTIGVFAVMFGALLWIYHNKKAEVEVVYDPDAKEAIVNNKSELKNEKTQPNKTTKHKQPKSKKKKLKERG